MTRPSRFSPEVRERAVRMVLEPLEGRRRRRARDAHRVAWYNADRLLEPLGDVPPAEFEQAFYERQADAAQLAVLT